MRALVQRVARAEVRVEGRSVGHIEKGLLVLIGFGKGDREEHLPKMADKLSALRIFPDAEGKMNLDVRDAEGQVLLVSQFTLYGDVRKGNRPSFVEAADPGEAEGWYTRLGRLLNERGLVVEYGRFGAAMEVELVNDGPVTLMIEL
ncbi:D-tyrosyl-tRNA(Tyr) deacylase [bacterium]|nr:D-tyrosyl-tRNA(Tyr) deacylase [bacterium]